MGLAEYSVPGWRRPIGLPDLSGEAGRRAAQQLTDLFNKAIDACFVEPKCKLSSIQETSTGVRCLYDCTVMNKGMRVVHSNSKGCAPDIKPGEGNPYP